MLSAEKYYFEHYVPACGNILDLSFAEAYAEYYHEEKLKEQKAFPELDGLNSGLDRIENICNNILGDK